MVCGGSIEKAKGNDVHPMFVFTEEVAFITPAMSRSTVFRPLYL